ncbi:DUF397 domain-containing protein [Streptomyces sp. NPDC044780]|uniref:DUF397 domain-containing protein n=1 Tax=unclassified Streptomyces TaxID=2593676 RepID=UPI0033D456C0
MSAPIQWRKSTFSGGQGPDCVEVSRSRDAVLLRESDEPRAVLSLDPSRFAMFLAAAKAGEFDALAGRIR